MKKYRKKPTLVEAIQFTDKTKDQVFNYIHGNRRAEFENNTPILIIQTIHGDEAIVRLGDWVLKSEVPGDYWPVKPDIFDKLYEPVDNL